MPILIALLAAIISLLTACGSASAPVGAKPPTSIVVDAAMTQEQFEAIADAVVVWNERLGVEALAIVVEDDCSKWPDGVCIAVCPVDDGALAETWGRLKGRVCLRDATVDAQGIIEHELGHVLGLDDVEQPGRLMNVDWTGGDDVTVAEAEAALEFWLVH